MDYTALRNTQFAGALLSAVLLASTPAISQSSVRSIRPQQSIVTLDSGPRPQGTTLARHAGDARFENVPANYHVFAAATVGEDAGVETLTLNFAGETTLTNIRMSNKDFVIEPGGSCYEGNHYSSGQSCSLLVRFNPQGPGHRLGFVRIANSAEPAAASFGLTGNGYAPVVSFTPSEITTVPGTTTAGTGVINSATSIAVDGGDILYIADTGNDKMENIDSSGTFSNTGLAPIATPASLAVDSFGILYTANTHGSTYYFSIYYPWGTQTAYGYAYTSSTCTVSAPCAFSTVGMNYPANMSIDPNDNLFFEEETTGAAEMPVASVSGGSGASLNLWHLSDQFSYSSGSPASFAVDAEDNLYTDYNFSSGTCFLVQEPLYNAENSPTANRIAGGTKCGFSGDGGQARGAEISSTIGQIAFDVAGNLYFADSGNQRVRRIDAATGIISTIAGNGTAGYTGDLGAATLATLSNPTGVAVDSQGQVYILSNAPKAGPTQAVRKIGQVGIWNFGALLKGTSSAAKVFTVANTGNNVLTLAANAFFNGLNPTDYAIDPNTTTCVLTAGATLSPGNSCKIGIIFKPSGVGSRTAALLLSDNTVAGINTIQLLGSGTLPAPTMTITSPTSGSTVIAGTTVTFSVSVTSTSSTKPTGTVTFKVNNTAIGSPVTLSSSGTASTTFSETTASTYTLSATYSGDSNYAAASVSESLGVTASTVRVVLQSVGGTASVCGMDNFSVRVISASGTTPTGTVELISGSTKLSSATLENGSAVLSAIAPMNGPRSFVANYTGDRSHAPAVSAAVSPTIANCSDKLHYDAPTETRLAEPRIQ